MPRFILTASIILAISATSLHADWPQWRGPDANGINTDAKNLPVEWNDSQNIAWKVALPAWSGATPIIFGDRVFVMSPSPQPEGEATETAPQQPRRQRPAGQVGQRPGGQGQRPAGQVGQRPNRGGGGRPRGGGGYQGAVSGPGGQELLLICLSRKDGSELWRNEVDSGNELKRKQNNSSPSPISDGKHVWATTGNGIVRAYTVDGEALWQFDLQKEYGDFGLNWGFASTPLLYEGKLIIGAVRGQNTDAPGYVVALDGKTGKVIWYVDRPSDAPWESKDAYTTPIPVEVDGKTQIVVSGGAYVTSHDPDTGKEIWRSGGLNPENARNYRIIASPVAANGLVYAPSRKTPLLAIKADGKGDVTDSHLAWKLEDRAGPDVPTPISDGKYFYVLNDFGQISCYDAKSGDTIWGPEETGIGRVSSSPVLADGKLFLVSETAEVAVVKAGGTFELLGKSALDNSYTLSSPAVAGTQVFIRTGNHLYCLSKG